MPIPSSLIRTASREVAQSPVVHRIMNPRMIQNAIAAGQIRPTMGERGAMNFIENAWLPNNGGIIANYSNPNIEEIRPGRYVLRNEPISIDDPNLTVSYTDASGTEHINEPVTPELVAEAQQIIPSKIESEIRPLPPLPEEVHISGPIVPPPSSLPNQADLLAAKNRLLALNRKKWSVVWDSDRAMYVELPYTPLSPELLEEENALVKLMDDYTAYNGTPFTGVRTWEGAITDYASTPIYNDDSGTFSTHYTDDAGNRLLYRDYGKNQGTSKNVREALRIIQRMPRGHYLQDMCLSSQSFPLVLRSAAANYGTGAGQASVTLTDDSTITNSLGDYAVYWDDLFSTENKKYAPVLQKVEDIAKEVNMHTPHNRQDAMLNALDTSLTPEERLQFEGVLKDLYTSAQTEAINFAKNAAGKLVQQDDTLAPILDRFEEIPFSYDVVGPKVLSTGKSPALYRRPVIRVHKHKLGGFYKSPLHKSDK